jgi:predicted dehydrogenase
MSAPTSAAPLRVALAGAGFIATRGHLPVIQRHPDTEAVALVEVNPQRAAAVADQFSIPLVYSDYATMLREAQPDLVIIGTPNVFHAPMSIAAMEAGAHVLCEKPMALTVADAQAMVETSRRTGRVFTIGLHNRFRPEMDLLKKLIEEGQLGGVY